MEEVKKQGTESLFVPYKIALELKELGFDEPCFGYRDGCGYLMIKSIPHCVISAPTFSQAFRFFRQKYFKMSYVYYDLEYKFCFCIGYKNKTKGYDTYEDAELECLKKLIELAKEQNVK